jgi:uncharacterized membrane protein
VCFSECVNAINPYIRFHYVGNCISLTGLSVIIFTLSLRVIDFMSISILCFWSVFLLEMVTVA